MAKPPTISKHSMIKVKNGILGKNFNIKRKFNLLTYSTISTRPNVKYAISKITRFTNYHIKIYVVYSPNKFQILKWNI